MHHFKRKNITNPEVCMNTTNNQITYELTCLFQNRRNLWACWRFMIMSVQPSILNCCYTSIIILKEGL